MRLIGTAKLQPSFGSNVFNVGAVGVPDAMAKCCVEPWGGVVDAASAEAKEHVIPRARRSRLPALPGRVVPAPASPKLDQDAEASPHTTHRTRTRPRTRTHLCLFTCLLAYSLTHVLTVLSLEFWALGLGPYDCPTTWRVSRSRLGQQMSPQ
jgi:hypothetical protein